MANNRTDNTTQYPTNGKETYIYCSVLPSDRKIETKTIQLVVVYVTVVVQLCFFFKVSCAIKARKCLQTSANVLVLAFLLSEISAVLYRVVIASVVLIKEELWVSELSAYIGTFLYQYVLVTNSFCRMILSVEKLLYVKYPFLHIKMQITVRRTITFLIAGFLFLNLPTLLLLYFNFETLYYKQGAYVIAVFKTRAQNVLLLFLQITFPFVTFVVHFQLYRFAQHIIKTSSQNGTKIRSEKDTRLDVNKERVLSNMFSIALPVIVISSATILDRLCISLVKSGEIQRAVSLMVIVLRGFNPFLCLYGNVPLRKAVLNNTSYFVPLWLQDIQRQAGLNRTNH